MTRFYFSIYPTPSRLLRLQAEKIDTSENTWVHLSETVQIISKKMQTRVN